MTMQELVLAQLRDLITSGEVAAGSQLVQEDLAQRWQVSRVPIREALRALSAEGLIEYFPHRGFFVANLSAEDLAEVYDLRALLEEQVLLRAADKCTPRDAEAIEELLRGVEEAATPSERAESNRRFHFAIFDLAQMPRAVRLLEQLWDATEAYRAVYFSLPESTRTIHGEHRALYAAVAAGSGEQAVAAQKAHRDHAQEAVSAHLQAAHQ